MNKPAFHENRPLDHIIDEIRSKRSVVSGKFIVKNFQTHRPSVFFQFKYKQDGRVALAYFSQEYKYFDQQMPKVKNETTVWNLVCESFLQTSMPPLISIFYAKEGVSGIFVQNFLSHSTEKFCWGTLMVYQKILGSETFCASERGGYQVSSSKFFCHTVPKNFVGEYFGVSKNFVHRKILCKRRGYHSTQLKNLCLTVPIKFVGEHLSVSKESLYRKIPSNGGGIFTVSSRIFLYLTGPKKLRQGTILCFRKILVGKILYG